MMEVRIDPDGNEVPWWDTDFTEADRGNVYQQAVKVWLSGKNNFRDQFINLSLKKHLEIYNLRAATMLEF